MDKEDNSAFASLEFLQAPFHDDMGTPARAKIPKEAHQIDFLQQVIICNDDEKREQRQQLLTIENDEPGEMYPMKPGESDISTPKEIRHVEIEILPKAKARKVIVLNILKPRRLLFPITQLEEQHLKFKQAERKIHNTGKHFKMLVEKYNDLNEEFSITSGDFQILEHEQNDVIDNHLERNAEPQVECSNVSVIPMDWNTEIEKEASIAGDVVNATKKYDGIKKCLPENQNVLADIHSADKINNLCDRTEKLNNASSW